MKKTKTKLVKFTEEEWELISKKADENGMKIGTYIQTIAVHGSVIKCNINDNKVLQQMIQIHTDLNRIGNNINQVAYKVNSINKVYQADMNVMQKQFENMKNQYYLLLDNVQEYITICTNTIRKISNKRS